MYLFLCSVCNDEEFLRRFDFGWVDIVHLCIFNLVLFKKKKYFDVDSEIIPYVKNNWFYLQIPAQVRTTPYNLIHHKFSVQYIFLKPVVLW